MSFKFFSDRIVTSKVSLEEAVKKASSAKAEEIPSLDELLDRLAAENKQQKTAGTEQAVKTAAAPAAPEAPKAEEKQASPDVKVEVSSELSPDKKANLDNLGDKKAKPFGKKDEDGEKEEKEEKKDGEKEEACMASSDKTVKIAMKKEIDFRGWDAADVVKAWDQHGGFKECVKNVGDRTDNPKLYCGLLQTASNMAKESIVKQAASAKQEKAAEAKPKKGQWKKIAKLNDDQRSWLADYLGRIYGEKYVKALLEDY